MAAQSHPPIIPFPTAAQTSQAVTTLIEVVTDPTAGHDGCCVTNAAWVVIGYACERFSEPCPINAANQPPQGSAARIEMLRNVKDHCDGVSFGAPGDIPWRLILDMVYQILLTFFPLTAKT